MKESQTDLDKLFLGLGELPLVLEEHGELVVDLFGLLVGRQPGQLEREVELVVVTSVVDAFTFRHGLDSLWFFSPLCTDVDSPPVSFFSLSSQAVPAMPLKYD